MKHYYTTESVGIATGMVITAIHNAGLASLTHPYELSERAIGQARERETLSPSCGRISGGKCKGP